MYTHKCLHIHMSTINASFFHKSITIDITSSLFLSYLNTFSLTFFLHTTYCSSHLVASHPPQPTSSYCTFFHLPSSLFNHFIPCIEPTLTIQHFNSSCTTVPFSICTPNNLVTPSIPNNLTTLSTPNNRSPPPFPTI